MNAEPFAERQLGETAESPSGREGTMPSDETRRVLKVFGVAVTAYEDAVEKGSPAEEMAKAEAEVRTRLQEVTALIECLRAKKK